MKTNKLNEIPDQSKAKSIFENGMRISDFKRKLADAKKSGQFEISLTHSLLDYQLDQEELKLQSTILLTTKFFLTDYPYLKEQVGYNDESLDCPGCLTDAFRKIISDYKLLQHFMVFALIRLDENVIL